MTLRTNFVFHFFPQSGGEVLLHFFSNNLGQCVINGGVKLRNTKHVQKTIVLNKFSFATFLFNHYIIISLYHYIIYQTIVCCINDCVTHGQERRSVQPLTFSGICTYNIYGNTYKIPMSISFFHIALNSHFIKLYRNQSCYFISNSGDKLIL